jgi:hypothetical protein
MKIPAGANPALVCSNDPTRYHLNFVKIESGHAIATDGRRIVVQQIELEETDARAACVIFKDVVKRAVEAVTSCYNDDEGEFCREFTGPATIAIDEEDVRVELDSMTVVGHEYDRHPFPQWSEVLPALDLESQPRVRVGLNAKLLAEIAEALDPESHCVALDILPGCSLDGKSPILVTTRHKDRVAILIPTKLNATAELSENTAWAFANEQRLMRLAEKESASIAATA